MGPLNKGEREGLEIYPSVRFGRGALRGTASAQKGELIDHVRIIVSTGRNDWSEAHRPPPPSNKICELRMVEKRKISI